MAMHLLKKGKKDRNDTKELNTSTSDTCTQMTTHHPNNWHVSFQIPIPKIRKLRLWNSRNLPRVRRLENY